MPIQEGMESQACEVEEVWRLRWTLGVARGAGDQCSRAGSHQGGARDHHSRADGTEDPHSGAEDHQVHAVQLMEG